MDEGLFSFSPMVLTVVRTAYIFCEAWREKRCEAATIAYHNRVSSGMFHPGLTLGYELYTLKLHSDPGEMKSMKRLL